MHNDFIQKAIVGSHIFLLFIGLLLLPLLVAHGATSNFTVRTFVGSDTNPPTVPSSLTATPIAPTQIDLSWGASTDDILLEGYHVWRDDVLIATTSSITYSDTGLTSSTTYSYYVTAYDFFNNESASSSVATATTPGLPSPTSTLTVATSSTQYGSFFRPLGEAITAIQIIPEKDSVTIRYETFYHVRSVIKWGRTISYELGSLAEQAFSTHHEIHITGLSPGTTYSISLEGENKISKYGSMWSGTFATLAPEDIFPPGNVTALRAVKDGNDVVLSWKNPEDPDLQKVRVVRSDKFFPSDIADGWVVYEGNAMRVRDVGKAQIGVRQYYTVFSYDDLGNISSGAVVSFYFDDGNTPAKSIINPGANTMALSLDDVAFMQEGEVLPHEDGKIHIDGAKQLTISIPYDRVPEDLKTILVVIGDSIDDEKSFTFLLRINKGKSSYTAMLAPFGVSGTFPVQVSVFDYKTAQIGYTNGVLVSEIQAIRIDNGSIGIPTGFAGTLVQLVQSYIFWIILLLLIMMYTGRRLLQSDV